MCVWILIGLCIITKVHGFADGNFPQACQSMSPEHPSRGVPVLPQNTKPPYKVNYTPGNKGEPITVSLESNPGHKFKGFMLEARETQRVDEGTPVGRFIQLQSDTRLLTCSHSAGAVSNRYNVGKTSIRVNWTAEGAELDITFRATFLESYTIFWEQVDRNVIIQTTAPPPTTQPSTTTSTVKPSTVKPSTVKPSTVEPSTVKPSTVKPSTVKPSTVEPSTAELSTTNSSPVTTSISSSTTLNTQRGPDAFSLKQGGTVQMSLDILFVGLKMELPNIITITITSSLFSRRLIKVSNILCSLLCMAVEISAPILFCANDSCTVTLIALMCVVIVINFMDLVIVSLPIGPSHELKEICDLGAKVCSVIHMVFTIAALFVAVLEIDDCRSNRKDSWLLKVMIAYIVWILLFVIWTFVFSIYRNKILERNKTGSSVRNKTWREQGKKNKLSAAEVIVTVVSVILIVGTLSFTVTVIAGIFLAKQTCA
ncbi:uncharacterized protein LOC118321411 [Morone saxatilis]|uniref:uncharacterized protein LOC118321411 n=1 Tax=Morone saxatilis TaxID=34816 RepID=UPI0015E1C7BE|nr:uncharacterized protein LOC118321411 [Morone saxatilis]